MQGNYRINTMQSIAQTCAADHYMHIVYILCMYLLNFVNLLLACWILLEEIRKG